MKIWTRLTDDMDSSDFRAFCFIFCLCATLFSFAGLGIYNLGHYWKNLRIEHRLHIEAKVRAMSLEQARKSIQEALAELNRIDNIEKGGK